MEHRCGTRHAVDVPVYVRTRDGLPSGFGRLREVSASGGLVESRLDLEPPSRVAVQLLTNWHGASQPGPASQPLIVEAQVIRLGLRGMYLEWTEYSPDLVRHLLEHRDERLGDRGSLAADGRDGVSTAVLAPLAESLGLLELRD